MSVVEKTTHVAEAINKLAQQYRDQSNLENFISAFVEEVQELEGHTVDVLEISDLDSQVGEQLDLIGRLVGRDREGRTDAEYKQWLQAQILLNRASGTGDDILTFLILVTPDGYTYQITEDWPAAFIVKFTTVVDNDTVQNLYSVLKNAKPIGVRYQQYWYVDEDTFQFSDTDATKTDADKGFGDDTLTTVGGLFSSARG